MRWPDSGGLEGAGDGTGASASRREVEVTEKRTPESQLPISAIETAVTHRSAATPSEHPPYINYKVWSKRERRWLTLTFAEYQAWLARPDLDPAEFATAERAS
jgi:hypothetical protein